MRFIWKIIRGFLVVIGLFVVLSITLACLALRSHMEPKLPAQMVLGYTFNGTPKDAPAAPGWMMKFGGLEPTLAEVVEGINRAAKDARVSALAVQLGAGDYDWADVQELQAAIHNFRSEGKRTYVYAESYGDLYPGMAEYYLASSFDEIWMQPVGSVAITGFAADVPYVKGLLTKIGVNPEVTQRGDYKTAPESLILEHMSPQQRETLHGIMSSMMTDFFDGVAKSRKLNVAQIGVLIDGAPYTADEAKERKLIDVVGYQDELMEKIIPEGDDKSELVNLIDYYDATSHDFLKQVAHAEEKGLNTPKSKLSKETSKGKSVALVYVTGMIVPGSGDRGGAFGDSNAWADDIAWDITDATTDDDVGAIVVRIDSPGGSPSASETIRRAIEVAKERGKYVVVSMGSEAASGGYWIAVNADRIYAMPGTLTGSIGVFGGKPDLSVMWDKLGVNWDSIKLGANAGMWSPNRPYGPEAKASVERMMDDIYDGFIERVAKGRNFSKDVVEGMAGGRVWTGRQAKERGLVDAIGGLDDALDDVAGHLDVTRANMDIFVLPDQTNPLREIMGFLGTSGRILDGLKPWMDAYARADNPALGMVYSPNSLP